MRRNKISLPFCIMVLAFINLIPCSPSQAQNSASFFGFKGGASIPLGDYRQTNLDGGSFAITGYNVTIEGAWFFKPRLGIGGQASIQQHPVEVGLLGWEKVKADSSLKDLYIRSEPYLVLTGMAGIYYRQEILSKLSIESKLLAGLLYGKTPYQLYKPQYDPEGPEYYEITSAQDWNLSINFGVGVQYDITPCYSFLLDSDFTYSNLAFSFISANGTRIDKRTIFFMNTSLGLRIRL